MFLGRLFRSSLNVSHFSNASSPLLSLAVVFYLLHAKEVQSVHNPNLSSPVNTRAKDEMFIAPDLETIFDSVRTKFLVVHGRFIKRSLDIFDLFSLLICSIGSTFVSLRRRLQGSCSLFYRNLDRMLVLEGEKHVLCLFILDTPNRFLSLLFLRHAKPYGQRWICFSSCHR